MGNSLTRWLARSTRPAPVRRRMRPGIELLEDRSVPAVFEVNTLLDTVDADPAITSLREAITAANDLAGDDSITFAAGLTGTINLASVLPDLSSNIAISGPGADLLEVRRDTGGNYRIFNVPAGATVVLSDLKISNGNFPEEYGGGIFCEGTLTLSNTTLTGNSAEYGAGLAISMGGTATVTGSTFSGNSAFDWAGGIYNRGTVAVIGSTVSDNSAGIGQPGWAGAGGGILNDGDLTVTGSTVSGNSAILGLGGGIYNRATLTVTGSTISGNSAGADLSGGGGAIFHEFGRLTLTNATVSGNSSTVSAGAMYMFGGSVTLTNVTVTANRADADNNGSGGVGGIRIGGGVLTLHNTLVAGNFEGAGTVRDDVNGAVAAASSYNLIGDGAGLTGISHNDANGNQVGTADAPIDPLLSPLEDYGGSTLTHALLLGSPALDRGLFVGAPANDQRGFGRFGPTDIGAYERQGFEVNTLADTVDDDPSVISLREAIILANQQPGDDSITFAAGLAGTIHLDTALPGLDSNLAISGPGAERLTVRRNDNADEFRIFRVPWGVTVVISGLKMSNGNGADVYGGGIYNAGTLTLNRCIVADNFGYEGGGIYNTGYLLVADSTVSANIAHSLRAGGIYNYGRLTLTGSAVTGNASLYWHSGGIYNDGTATLIDSTISGNSAKDRGGGIVNDLILTVTNSTISGNSAQDGGGIWNGGFLTITNSTLSGNYAGIEGGGLFQRSGSAALFNVTITANRGVNGVGGIRRTSGTLTLHNTLVAGNLTGYGTSRADINGAVISGSDFNLIGDGTGMTGISHDDANGNQVGTADAPIDPRLGPLQNNGGPTLTHALLTGSPAVDRGLAPGAPLSDQRGVGRFGVPDIGAYELPPPLGVNQVVKVTGRISVAKNKQTLTSAGRIRQKVTLTNISTERIQGPISLVLDKLTAGVNLWKPAGKTKVWQPLGSFYLNGLPADGILDPGERLSFVLEFVVPPSIGFSPIGYKVRVLAGKGPR